MSDPLGEQIAKYGALDEEESWQGFKLGFLTKPPQARIADLKTADQWLALQDGLTREHASMVVKKRELETMHYTLLKAQR
jgi:hypothetical protein